MPDPTPNRAAWPGRAGRGRVGNARAPAAEKIKLLIVDGQNNHKWRDAMTRLP